MIQNFKKFFKENEADIILVIGVVLISLMSFGGGWLMGINSVLPQTAAKKDNIKIEETSPDDLKASTSEAIENEAIENAQEEKPAETSNNPETLPETSQGEEVKNSTEEPTLNSTQTTQNEKQIVASKNGETYYYVWCSGANRIKEENKIYFNSKEEAEKAGYREAKNNCSE